MELPRRGSDRRCVERAQRERTPAARREAVARFGPLARSLARRYAHGSEALEDLEQVAFVGLLKAIDGFDPSRGAAFTSYAVPTITGELRRHFRDRGWTVRVPRRLQELVVRLPAAQEGLVRELGRSPTAAELADRLAVSVEGLLEAREARSAMRPASLDRLVAEDDAAGGCLLDRFGAEDPDFARTDDAVALAGLLRELPERERTVVELRFGEELTQSEIASRVGMSQMWVSLALRRSLATLEERAGAWAA